MLEGIKIKKEPNEEVLESEQQIEEKDLKKDRDWELGKRMIKEINNLDNLIRERIALEKDLNEKLKKREDSAMEIEIQSKIIEINKEIQNTHVAINMLEDEIEEYENESK